VIPEAKHRASRASRPQLITNENSTRDKSSSWPLPANCTMHFRADVLHGFRGEILSPASQTYSSWRKPIVFAMANPIPEIHARESTARGARSLRQVGRTIRIRSTTRSSSRGFFRGALDNHVTKITDEMKLCRGACTRQLIKNRPARK